MKVTVSITLSKTITVEPKEGEDLKKVVESQYILPQEAHKCVFSYALEAGHKSSPEANMLRDWIVDDYQIIEE